MSKKLNLSHNCDMSTMKTWKEDTLHKHTSQNPCMHIGERKQTEGEETKKT